MGNVKFNLISEYLLALIYISVYSQSKLQLSNMWYVLQIHSVICTLLHHCVMCHKNQECTINDLVCIST